MATLELEFNCMCLFATDRNDGAVHVLLPATHHHHGSHHEPTPAPGHDHDHHDHPKPQPEPSAHHEQHLVRMLHSSFTGKKGRSMEGWALELTGVPTPTDHPLRPSVKPEAEDLEIVDLSAVTGTSVPRAILAATAFPRHLAARVTLRGGSLISLEDEGTVWEMGGREVVMAHKAVWRIEGLTDEMKWTDLGASHGPPVQSLSGLAPDEDGTYRLSIHHVTEKGLPPLGLGVLSGEEVAAHFGAYYSVLKPAPEPPPLPRYVSGLQGGKYNCKTAQAEMEWP